MLIIGDSPHESEMQRLEDRPQMQQEVPFGTLEEQNDLETVVKAGVNYLPQQ